MVTQQSICLYPPKFVSTIITVKLMVFAIAVVKSSMQVGTECHHHSHQIEFVNQCPMPGFNFLCSQTAAGSGFDSAFAGVSGWTARSTAAFAYPSQMTEFDRSQGSTY